MSNGVGTIVSLAAFVAIMLVSSCSKNDEGERINAPSKALDKGSVEEVVRSYLDSNDWKYDEYMDEDSTITFVSGIKGVNESVKVHIDVDPSSNDYTIICRSAETKLPPQAIPDGIRQMNEFNLSSTVVSGCINKEGDIIFWLGRNTLNNQITLEEFLEDFHMTVAFADFETAQIAKVACAQ